MVYCLDFVVKPGRVSTKFKCSNCFFSKVKKHVITFGRRIADKFQSMNMELKNISVCFDCSNLHGNRHLGNFSIFFLASFRYFQFSRTCCCLFLCLLFVDLHQFKGLPLNAAGLVGGAGINVGLPARHPVQSSAQCRSSIG